MALFRVYRAAGVCIPSSGPYPFLPLARVPLSNPRLPPAPGPTPAAHAPPGDLPGPSASSMALALEDRGKSKSLKTARGKPLCPPSPPSPFTFLRPSPRPGSTGAPRGKAGCPPLQLPQPAGRSSARGSCRERKLRGSPRPITTRPSRRQREGCRRGSLQTGGTCLRLAPKAKSETKHRKREEEKKGGNNEKREESVQIATLPGDAAAAPLRGRPRGQPRERARPHCAPRAARSFAWDDEFGPSRPIGAVGSGGRRGTFPPPLPLPLPTPPDSRGSLQPWGAPGVKWCGCGQKWGALLTPSQTSAASWEGY